MILCKGIPLKFQFSKEGKVLNANLLESSITRMKQLGLVTIEKMPDIKPDPNDPQKINITAEVKEMNRQMEMVDKRL